MSHVPPDAKDGNGESDGRKDAKFESKGELVVITKWHGLHKSALLERMLVSAYILNAVIFKMKSAALCMFVLG